MGPDPRGQACGHQQQVAAPASDTVSAEPSPRALRTPPRFHMNSQDLAPRSLIADEATAIGMSAGLGQPPHPQGSQPSCPHHYALSLWPQSLGL